MLTDTAEIFLYLFIHLEKIKEYLVTIIVKNFRFNPSHFINLVNFYLSYYNFIYAVSTASSPTYIPEMYCQCKLEK